MAYLMALIMFSWSKFLQIIKGFFSFCFSLKPSFSSEKEIEIKRTTNGTHEKIPGFMLGSLLSIPEKTSYLFINLVDPLLLFDLSKHDSTSLHHPPPYINHPTQYQRFILISQQNCIKTIEFTIYIFFG